MKKEVTNKMKETEVKKVVDNESLSKSERMKQLFEGGLEIKEISQLMNVRYNFVYNVISNYVNMNGITVINEQKESKKEKIIELFKQGKSLKEISITLKTNYNYVFNVTKELKDTNKKNVQ